jgi:LacI family transcriptional regulator
VSHVLDHPELVRPETRARVEAAIARLGFVPNASARHLVSGRSDTMAFLVPDAANPFYTDVARACARRRTRWGSR